jgi:hypothetical protein
LPANGGEAVQVTGNGGLIQVESEDGKTIYYTSSDDELKPDNRLWKIAVDGSGPATPVLESIYAHSFSVGHDGIYYIRPPGLQFLNFATGTSRLILGLSKRPVGYMSVSPDGHWLLYDQVDQEGGSDLMLVENFR